MNNPKHTPGHIVITNNTDSIDIAAKCIGLDIDRKSIPSDVRHHLRRNRGLHIQIRHNGDKQTFDQVNAAAKLIAASPDMLEALLDARDSLEYAILLVEAPKKSLMRENLELVIDAIAKATGGAK